MDGTSPGVTRKGGAYIALLGWDRVTRVDLIDESSDCKTVYTGSIPVVASKHFEFPVILGDRGIRRPAAFAIGGYFVIAPRRSPVAQW